MTQQARIGLIVFGIGGGVFLVVVLGVVIIAASKDKPTTKAGTVTSNTAGSGAPVISNPSLADGKNWSLTELADHLRRNGFPKTKTFNDGTFTWLLLTGEGNPNGVFDKSQEHRDAITKGAVQVVINLPSDNFNAATYNRNLAENERATNWAWGPFQFAASSDWLAKLRRALGGS